MDHFYRAKREMLIRWGHDSSELNNRVFAPLSTKAKGNNLIGSYSFTQPIHTLINQLMYRYFDTTLPSSSSHHLMHPIVRTMFAIHRIGVFDLDSQRLGKAGIETRYVSAINDPFILHPS